MATVIIIALLAAICVFGVISYCKKLKHGCCGAGGDSEQRVEKSFNPAEYQFHYTIKIGGMSCGKCAARIENAFSRRDGIHAKADYKSGRAEVYAKQPIPEPVLRTTVVELGYSVEEVISHEL